MLLSSLLLLGAVGLHVTCPQGVGTGAVLLKDGNACSSTKVHLIQTLDFCMGEVCAQHHGQVTLGVKLEAKEPEAKECWVGACDTCGVGYMSLVRSLLKGRIGVEGKTTIVLNAKTHGDVVM